MCLFPAPFADVQPSLLFGVSAPVVISVFSLFTVCITCLCVEGGTVASVTCCTPCFCMWQDLKDLLRNAGEVTYADAHKQKSGEA